MKSPPFSIFYSSIKLLIVTLSTCILTPTISREETSFYFKYYDEYLEPDLPEYPYRRMELMRKINSMSDSDSSRLKELLYQKDLDYLSQVSSILDLWALRVNDKWRSESLADVSKTAVFCLRNFDTDIDLGVSKEVGIIACLQLQLFNSPKARDRAALLELLAELRKIKARNKFIAQQQEYYDNLRKVGASDLSSLSEQMTKDYIEALKRVLYGSSKNPEIFNTD